MQHPDRLSSFLPSLDQAMETSVKLVTADTVLSDIVKWMGGQADYRCTLPERKDRTLRQSGELPPDCVLVAEGAHLAGIITEGDIVRLTALGEDLAAVRAGEVMSREMVTLVQDGRQDILGALDLMRRHNVRHLPVLDGGGRVTGLLSAGGIRRTLQPIHLLTLRSVAEVMTAPVVHAPADSLLVDLARLMASRRVSCVVIAEPHTDGVHVRPVGLITESDIVQFRYLQFDLAQTRAAAVMSAVLSPLKPFESVLVAHQQMLRRRVRRLVVTGERGELVGIVTQSGLLRLLDPLDIFGVIEALQRSIYQLEAEKVELLQGRTHQLERLVEERTAQLQEQARREQLARAAAESARQEAEEANRIKDEFLATLSHELRTPLNPIIGFTQLLRKGQLDEESAARALETIERNARAQSRIIEDMLDLSRIITGKLRLEVRPVALATLVEDALDTVRFAAQSKKIELQAHLDPNVVLPLGDPNRLQQVVWNLLSNAIKFTPECGRIDVRLESSQTEAALIVRDSGVGIAADFLPHVFERFRQANSTTTRSHGGLGLGLAIVRQLVELHGGTVAVESSGVNQGSTFTVRLPLSMERGAPVIPGHTPPPAEAMGLQVVTVVTDCLLDGHTLAETDLRRRYGVVVHALRREGQLIGFPDADTPLREGDQLLVSGGRDQLERLRQRMKESRE
ncbi:MAG: CBS domain-containing protein [Aphanocapsa lilacina HA4352-LM1]|jgi:signal transduction histidine kinase|nr:CBS domain-containing protein [Aphanocapsa lilacina HA4352-LM1]